MYCMPEDGVQFTPHIEILTYEEMLRIVGLCIEKGIRKVRLTGGEPLVRRGIVSFIDRLNQIRGLEKIALTTNGVLLKEFSSDLRDIGLSHINISLDTLRRDRFWRITGRDFFGRVWEGLKKLTPWGSIQSR
jgi:cyclic pyranopterin phosphate synthase